jgi:murein DD-endopeptidase MepM/ murein hydrolase activator NlpD
MRAYIRNIKDRHVQIKGFLKDPLFGFGVFSVILLGGILVFTPKAALKSLAQAGFSFSETAMRANSAPQESLFIEPVKNFLKDSPELSLVQENSIAKVSSPIIVTSQTLAALSDANDAENGDRKEIIEYVVEKGDTISSVAAKFNISVNTILWANNLNRGSVVKPGDKLIVLPVSGVIYHVKRGDTLSEITKTYKGKTDEIITFNDLSDERDIYVGDILIIPDGTMPVYTKPSSFAEIPVGSSYFICPHSACRLTQGLHWYNAVDIGGQCGDPLYAAAAGKVLKVKYGWNGGGGNYLTILHPNGTVTYYGHLVASLVNAEQEVSQGQIIALMGGKPGMPGAGNSTGCHVHFEVKGARNPFAR